MAIHILLVDDHDIVRTGIRRLLSDIPDIRIIAESANGEDAIKVAREKRPDVVLMDVRMPGIGGLEATKKMLHHNPRLRIIVLTVCEGDIFPEKLLQMGVAGYLTKGASLDEMVKAIRAVHGGERYVSADIARKIALKHVLGKEGNYLETLTERELQVVIMIAQGKKNQVIADQLFVSPKTINTYRYRIYEKLNVDNDVDIARYAIQHGIVDMEMNT
jgi:two-component system invasion response regulator UvrY